MSLVAFIPAQFPERYEWLGEAVSSADLADRILVIATYPRPENTKRWRRVEWIHDASLQNTGSKYREAVKRTEPEDVIGILDDDDLWLPSKVTTIQQLFSDRSLLYFAHSAAIIREGVPTGMLPPQNANGSMITFRRSLTMRPEIRPFFERLNWGCDTFMRYASLLLPSDVSKFSYTVLSHVRYHEQNSSHPPKGGYREFEKWQKEVAARYLESWELIDEMFRAAGRRAEEAPEKIAEFQRLIDSNPIRRRISYALSQQ